MQLPSQTLGRAQYYTQLTHIHRMQVVLMLHGDCGGASSKMNVSPSVEALRVSTIRTPVSPLHHAALQLP